MIQSQNKKEIKIKNPIYLSNHSSQDFAQIMDEVRIERRVTSIIHYPSKMTQEGAARCVR